MRGTVAVGAWLLLGQLAAAQQPERTPQAVAADLGSDDGRTVALAAQHAREHPDRAFVRPAAAALARWRERDSEHARLVCLHVLDALIALDARVPAGDLAALVDDDTCGMAAFVLLAREPRHHEPELFALFRRDWPAFDPQLVTAKDLRTLAIGNLLAPQAPPGFAALLLPAVDFQVCVRAVDASATAQVQRDRTAAAVRVALRRGAVRAGRAEPPELDGWPRRPTFLLEPPDLRRNAAEVPMPKASPLGLRVVRGAAETAQETMVLAALAAGHERPSPALQWLGVAAGLALPSVPRSVPLTEPAAFTELLVRARRQQQVFVDALRRELIARNALSEADAKPLERRVDVTVTDERTDRSVPLPPLPEPPR